MNTIPSALKRIDIRSYGKRYQYYYQISAGEGSSRLLWIPKKPNSKHAMTRHLKAIRFLPFATRKQILALMHEPNHPNYWAELHRYNYIEQFRCPDNSIVYHITEKGLNYLDRVTD